jgi:hypothetical protein
MVIWFKFGRQDTASPVGMFADMVQVWYPRYSIACNKGNWEQLVWFLVKVIMQLIVTLKG